MFYSVMLSGKTSINILTKNIHESGTSYLDTLKSIKVLLDKNNTLNLEDVIGKADSCWSEIDSLYEAHDMQIPFDSAHTFWWYIDLKNETSNMGRAEMSKKQIRQTH